MIPKKQKAINEDPLLSLKVGDEVQVKGADDNWIPARVQEVETRKTLDPKALGSPQRYKLYARDSDETFSIVSKYFKRDLRLEPLHEDKNDEAESEQYRVVAQQIPGAHADAQEDVLGKESEVLEDSTIDNGSIFFFVFLFFRLNQTKHLAFSYILF